MDEITGRILARLGDAALLDKLLALPRSDLNSLLLGLFRRQAEGASPPAVLKAFEANRFTRPSGTDPAAYHALESELLALAQGQGIQGVLLSPAAPLASCAAFGCVDQNNVLSSLRGTELLADPTNMLAIIMAQALKGGQPLPMHRCATARVVRGQAFPDAAEFLAHFGLFCIVSCGKASGGYATEKELLAKHLAYYKALLWQRHNAGLSVVLSRRGGYADGDGFWQAMRAFIADEWPDVPVACESGREDNRYYRGLNFKLYLEKDGQRLEVGDGGFVDWMEQMTGSKKQRCLISGMGIDRLMML